MTYTIEEQKQHRKDWVEALRSGKYEQGSGLLREGNYYCCIGVACEVAKIPFTKSSKDLYRYGEEENTDMAPDEAQEYYGLASEDGSLTLENTERYTSLTILNDQERWSFEDIADLIEKEPKGLFVDSND